MNSPPTKPGAAPPEIRADDPTIPVLTERLGLPPLDFDTTLPLIDTSTEGREALLEGLTALPSPPPAPPPPAPSRAKLAEKAPSQAPIRTERVAEAPRRAPEPPRVLGASAANPAPAPQPANDGRHWARIELDLRAAVLREISEQLPREVEAIVQTRMLESIDRLISALAAETRKAVAASMREIVERAVHAELERLRKASKV